MLGNLYSDIEMSHNQRFQFGKNLQSKDTALLLRCRRGNVS